MPTPNSSLPEPSAEALALSRSLAERVGRRIADAGGWIPFDEFMNAMLYEPGLGYYSAGHVKIGAAGDFVTAPQLSDSLAAAVVELYCETKRGLDAPVILELGAGTGRLAGQILDSLARRGDTASRYRILETSADLRARQRDTLARFGARVEWLDRLPQPGLEGLIVANEVADALPVRLFVKKDGQALPVGIEAGAGGFERAVGEPDPATQSAVDAIESSIGATLPDGYVSELRPMLGSWIAALSGALARGAILLIDYGAVRREYYHPQRASGTLMCHYRHRAHADPTILPGLQDITAWVDFSAAAEAGSAAGLRVAGFTTQAQFLLATLERNAASLLDSAAPADLSALKTLLLPGEMGERFKVLLLTKANTALALPGRDLRNRL